MDCDRSTDGRADPTSTAASLAEYVCSVLGPTARAALHYGSRAQGRATRPDSAFDFFIIVDSYRQAYQALAAQFGARYRGAMAFLLAWVLPPNAIAVRKRDTFGEHEAKCLILSTWHFRRECSPRARDHFVQGRLSQRILLAWHRDLESAEEVWGGVREVREHSFEWVRVFLPLQFDVATYCRTLLETSLSYEIRTEAKDHAEKLFTAQRDVLLNIYGSVLGCW